VYTPRVSSIPPFDPGAGDRWMAGESLPGVTFAQHDEVEIVEGRYAGRRGRVLLLVELPPQPTFLVALQSSVDLTTGTEVAVRVRQSALKPVPADTP
jgi:hypothetical protein